MLQWIMRLLCRPIIHKLDRTMTMYTENGLDTIMMITTDSPRLTVTSGEWYASDVFTQTRRDLRHTYDISDAVDCNAVVRSGLIFRQLMFPPGVMGTTVSPRLTLPRLTVARSKWIT